MSAKYGMEPAARRYLAYHSSGKDKSMLTYSRDAMSWPVRLMEEMIRQINDHHFDPDASQKWLFPCRRADGVRGQREGVIVFLL